MTANDRDPDHPLHGDELAAIVTDLLGRLERAWNAGDGHAYAAPFSSNAHFVDIRGGHHITAAAIAAGRQAIFDDFYRGSTISYTLRDASVLAPGCLLAHADATLEIPSGALAGTRSTRLTLVAVSYEGDWRIAAFHNTPILD